MVHDSGELLKELHVDEVGVEVGGPGWLRKAAASTFATVGTSPP
jgi:ribosomal protein S11